MDPDTLDIESQMSQHSIQHLDHFRQHSNSPLHQPKDAIIIKSDNQQQQQQRQSSQTLTMEIDTSNIKREQGMIITPEIVSMMTPGHMGKFKKKSAKCR